MSQSSKKTDVPVPAVSSPQVHLKIASEQEGKKEVDAAGETEMKNENNGSQVAAPVPATSASTSKAHVTGSLNPFLATVPVTAQVTRKQPFILMDEQGNEKSFGSALGLLTRKFVNLIHVSLTSLHAARVLSYPYNIALDLTQPFYIARYRPPRVALLI
jgi:hypothetical protein